MDQMIGVNSLGFYVERFLWFGIRDYERYEADLLRNWAHLRTMDAVARGYGAATLFSTFQFYDGKQGFNRLTNATLRALFDAHGLAYVDQDALIPDYDRSLQFDECHFTHAGDELMAENFFRKIVDEGFLNRAARPQPVN
jgi:hypothetical protein